MRNIVVEKFATPASDGAIQGGGDWVLDGLTVRLNHSLGVNGFRVFRNGLVYDNGQQGVSSGYGDGEIVENSEFGNNHRIPIICWHGGAVRFRHSRNTIVRNNYVHDDTCAGLTTDWNNIGTLYEGNRVEDVAFAGIMHEASCDATIRNNVIRRTGFGPGLGWIDGSGINVHASANVEVYGNTLEDNLHGIGGISMSRGSDSLCGTFGLRNLRVHDNVVKVTGRDGSGNWRIVSGVVGSITQPFEQQAFFDRNTYTACAQNLMAGPSAPGSTTYGYPTWSQWRAMGQDTQSTMSIVC